MYGWEDGVVEFFHGVGFVGINGVVGVDAKCEFFDCDFVNFAVEDIRKGEGDVCVEAFDFDGFVVFGVAFKVWNLD
jgi:hypothetical protein